MDWSIRIRILIPSGKDPVFPMKQHDHWKRVNFSNEKFANDMLTNKYSFL